MIGVFGRYYVLYALAVILIWVGGLKFFAFEARAVERHVTESLLLSWIYDVVDVRPFARILGSTEIAAGVAIALRSVLSCWSALGGRLRPCFCDHREGPVRHTRGRRDRRFPAALADARTVPRKGHHAARSIDLGPRRLARGHQQAHPRPRSGGRSRSLRQADDPAVTRL